MLVREPRDLGISIRTRRGETRLTADEVADLAGVSRRLLLELEQGKRPNVGLSKALRVLEILGLNMEIAPRGVPGALPRQA